MGTPLSYHPSTAGQFLDAIQLETLTPSLLAARDEVFADVDLRTSGEEIPEYKLPLDSAFVDLPKRLLDELQSQGDDSEVGRLKQVGQRLRDELERIVFLGIGGSYMGAKSLFDALLHPYHNLLPADQRDNIPQVFFEGNNLDNDAIASLQHVLQSAADWGIVVISKSGGTLETAAAFRLFREQLERQRNDESHCQRYIVPVTGETGKLRDLHNAKGYQDSFPIPDGVGGRFSILSAVGLLPAAVMGIDIEQLLQGAADITERFRTAELGDNPVLDYTAICHLWEQRGYDIRVLSTWGSRLESVGFWYDQLLSESLGKHEQGATPLTAVNTRDLHSRGQQHQEGTRNKLITNLTVAQPQTEPVVLPESDANQDQLNAHAGKTVPQFLSAALQGTNQAYTDVDRPTANLVLPTFDPYSLGQLFQMLMLATVLEGQLIHINPYGQPGVEDYKRNMNRILNQS